MTDARGAPFTSAFGRADIGGFEVQSLNLVVTTNQDKCDCGPNPGQVDYDSDNLSLQEALVLVNANPEPDTIRFHESLQDSTITLTSPLLVEDSVTIEGPGADQLTIDAGGGQSVFSVRAAGGDSSLLDVVISGLTLREGTEEVIDTSGAVNLTVRETIVTRGRRGITFETNNFSGPTDR